MRTTECIHRLGNSHNDSNGSKDNKYQIGNNLKCEVRDNDQMSGDDFLGEAVLTGEQLVSGFSGKPRYNTVRFGSQKMALNRSVHFLNFSSGLRREFPTASSGYVDTPEKERGIFPKMERNAFGECRPSSRRAR